jgi:hypothetical protein
MTSTHVVDLSDDPRLCEGGRRGARFASFASMTRYLLVALATVCAAPACGGAIQDDPSATGQASGDKTTFSAPGPTPAALAVQGSWDLVTLDGTAGGKKTTKTSGHFTMELRSDGKAIGRRCTKPYYEPGTVSMRCSDSMSYDCIYGEVRYDGAAWRVEFPDIRVPSHAEQGEIAPEGSDGIVVRYVLPSYAAGHFERIEGDSPTAACSGP